MPRELGLDVFDKITTNLMGRKRSKRDQSAMQRAYGQGEKGGNPRVRGWKRVEVISENKF